jgi:hypothetical protein
MKFNPRLASCLLSALCFVGCNYDKALKSLHEADRIRAFGREREKIIKSTADVQTLADMVAIPHRDWDLYVVDTPSSPLNLAFSKNGNEFATVELAPGWIIIEFHGKPHLAISSSLSKSEYERFANSVRSGARTE